MNKFIRKGITLIEIIIALSILSIVITVLSPFFISNLKALNNANYKLDLQRDGEKIIEQISYNSMGALGIVSLTDVHGNTINLSSEKTSLIRGITLNVNKFNEATGKIEAIPVPLNFDISKIESIKVSALPNTSTSTFFNAKGLNIEVKLDPAEAAPELKTEVHFRN